MFFKSDNKYFLFILRTKMSIFLFFPEFRIEIIFVQYFGLLQGGSLFILYAK